MNRTLTLVHTVSPLIEPFTSLCQRLVPGVRVFHVLDEAIIERIRQCGPDPEADADRLAGHVAIAEQIGSDAVLVTCSTVSQSVDRIRGRFRVPIVKIDDAMAAEAVRRGGRVGLVATAATTLEPSSALLGDAAARAGTTIEIEPLFVEGAFAALQRGDEREHDDRVSAAVRDIASRSDVVVLAQASMARVLDVLDPSPAVPVLASPHLALAEVGRILGPG